jgi:hypothetical protein
MSEADNEFVAFVKGFEEYLRGSFDELWSKVKIDPDNLEAYSVIGGLLARQVTLAIQLVRSPEAWNGHAAPLYLRSMADLQITLAWIMGDIAPRAKMYVLHGLGDVKLFIEHYKAELAQRPEDDETPNMRKLLEIKEQWLNSQRREFFVEVNLGHWSQLDTRKMAVESGNEGLYNFSFKPFSHVVHNMWPHISTYNSRICKDPLHRHHLVPAIPEIPLDVDYVYRACKYAHKTYRLFIDGLGIQLFAPLPLAWWNDFFANGDESGVVTPDDATRPDDGT